MNDDWGRGGFAYDHRCRSVVMNDYWCRMVLMDDHGGLVVVSPPRSQGERTRTSCDTPRDSTCLSSLTASITTSLS